MDVLSQANYAMVVEALLREGGVKVAAGQPFAAHITFDGKNLNLKWDDAAPVAVRRWVPGHRGGT